MSERTASSSRSWLIWLGVVVVLAALFFGLRVLLHDTPSVRTATATHQDMSSSVSANGKVEPVEEYQAHATAPGLVQNIYVRVGQHVGEGAQLLRMDDSDARKNVASAQAQVEMAEATLKNMQAGGTQDEQLSANADLASARAQRQQDATALASVQDLLAKGSASASEVAGAKQKLAADDARLEQLQTRRQGRYGSNDLAAQRAQVTQARAGLNAARSAYTGVDFRAPFAGTVYSIPVTMYDYVSGGEALLNMADLKHIQVRAYFDEPDIGKLVAGQAVKIVWDAKPGSAWYGHITLAPTTVITYGTRNVGECLINVDDAKGDLLPNTNVTVTVTTAQKFGVLSIPREALFPEGTKNFVYKIVNSHLKKTPVQVGAASNLTRAEISSGLSDGDVIALPTAGGVEFADGLEVKAAP